MTGNQAIVPARRLACSSSRSTASPAPGSASCCRTPREIADELCFVKSMHTEAINHDPAITFFQTGAQLAGRPSIGAWLAYGLGSENENLPAFVVLISRGAATATSRSTTRLWGSGFLPIAAPGRAVPRRQGPGALPGESRRRARRDAPATMLDEPRAS